MAGLGSSFGGREQGRYHGASDANIGGSVRPEIPESLVDRVTTLPINEAISARAANLFELGREAKKSSAVVSTEALLVSDVAGGGRALRTGLCLDSNVKPDGCYVYGTPVQNLSGLPAWEVFPTGLLGERPRPEDREELLNNYHQAAVTTGAYEKAYKSLLKAERDEDPMSILAKVFMDQPKTLGLDGAYAAMAILPWAVANTFRIRHGLDVIAPPESPYESPSKAFVETWGQASDPQVAEQFVERYQWLLFTHSTNLSFDASQRYTSGGGTPAGTAAAGIHFLATPAHGGAQSKIQPMMDDLIRFCELKEGELPTDEQLRDWALDRLERGEALDGFGHPVINLQHDPRGTDLKTFYLTIPGVSERWGFQLMDKVFTSLPEIIKSEEFQSIKAIKNPYTNVDFWASRGQVDQLNVTDSDCMVLLFALARTPDFLVGHLHRIWMKLPIMRALSLDEAGLEEAMAQG